MADPNELVYIKHTKVDAIGGPVTREAFDTVHKDKGWSLAKPDEVPDDIDAVRATRDVGAAATAVPPITTTTPKGS